MITRFKVFPASGYQKIFEIGKENIEWLDLEIIHLNPGEEWRSELQEGIEGALVPISGKMGVSMAGINEIRWDHLGGRADIFSAPPWVVYVPRQHRFTISAESKLELAIVRAPCTIDLPPVVINPKRSKQFHLVWQTGAAMCAWWFLPAQG